MHLSFVYTCVWIQRMKKGLRGSELGIPWGWGGTLVSRVDNRKEDLGLGWGLEDGDQGLCGPEEKISLLLLLLVFFD